MAGGTLACAAPPVLFDATPMLLLPAAETDACPTDAGYWKAKLPPGVVLGIVPKHTLLDVAPVTVIVLSPVAVIPVGISPSVSVWLCDPPAAPNVSPGKPATALVTRNADEPPMSSLMMETRPLLSGRLKVVDPSPAPQVVPSSRNSAE